MYMGVDKMNIDKNNTSIRLCIPPKHGKLENIRKAHIDLNKLLECKDMLKILDPRNEVVCLATNGVTEYSYNVYSDDKDVLILQDYIPKFSDLDTMYETIKEIVK